MLFYQLAILILCFLFLLRIQPKKINILSKWDLPLAFAVKIGAGLFFLFVYSLHYGKGALSADAGDYLRESTILHQVATVNFWDYLKLLTGIGETEELMYSYLGNTNHWDMLEYSLLNDAKNVIRFHSLVQFGSFGEPFVHEIAVCLLGLIPLYQLFVSIYPYSQLQPRLVFWLIVLLPSTLFWTSGILKEPFLFIGIGFVLRSLLDKNLKVKRKLLYFTIGLVFMLMFKPYVLICLLTALTFYFFTKYFFSNRPLVSLLTLMGLGLLILHLFPPLKNGLIQTLSYKQFDFRNIGRGGSHLYDGKSYYYVPLDQMEHLQFSEGNVTVKKPILAEQYSGKNANFEPTRLSANSNYQVAYRGIRCESYVSVTMIQNSYSQLVKNIPEALSISMIHPLPTDGGSWLKYPSMIETWSLLALMIYLIYHVKNRNKVNDILVISLMIFALSLLLLIGWTTPVIGAVARYRFPAQLAIAIAAIVYVQPTMWKKYV
ncbi:MAG: hypothetical protein N4A41_06355 [Crocinitomicaceae bacterium]|nr:hypothetical protein [Crocinitomicaceae bacterium]